MAADYTIEIITGAQGIPGRGVPTGGTTGQFLQKVSDDDFDTEWTSSTAAVAWGDLTGTLSDQTDLQNALDLKIESGDNISVLTNDSGFITGIGSESIGDLSDVTLTSLTDNEILVSAGGVFINRTFADAGLSQVGHTHTLSEITDFNANDYATGAEGDLASSAVQPGDNVSDLTNDAGYLTSVALDDVSDVTITTAAKGDLLVRTATGYVNLGVGTDGYVLKANSATTTGVEWSVDGGGPGSSAWGSITGTLSDQTDLHSALNGKANSSHTHTASDIISGTFDDARIAESNVTQHEGALSITKSQISDFVESDYATGAEGDLASSAVQPGDNVSDLTNDSGYLTNSDLGRSSATVQTTDATQTTLQSVAISTDTQRTLEFRVRGFESATTDMAWRTIRCAVKNVSGTTSLVGGVASDSGYDVGASTWDISVSVSGANVLLEVIGEAAHTIDWVTNTQVQ